MFLRKNQPTWCRIQEQNLIQIYIENEGLRLKMEMLAALAFVPPDGYLSGNYLGRPASYKDNYLGCPARYGQQRAPKFAIEMLSMYQRVELGLPSSNNAVEGWHRAFQHTEGYAHAAVYKLINSMRLEQSHTENLKAKIDVWQNVVRKNQKYVQVLLQLVDWWIILINKNR